MWMMSLGIKRRSLRNFCARIVLRLFSVRALGGYGTKKAGRGS
jgi:hypothetical protein